MNETWIGNKAYTSSVRVYNDTFPTVHSVSIARAFNKKEVALAIGLRMIADGCVKVESQYDIREMCHTYTWIARPFTKEKRLP